MNKIKNIVLSLGLLVFLVVASAYSSNGPVEDKMPVENKAVEETKVKSHQNQMANMFVSHGHCSLPFTGVVNDLKVDYQIREDQGNPLEDMSISFDIDVNTFFACHGEEFTESVRSPGLFRDGENDKMSFRSTNTYTMGLDWYQINGILSIKGVERPVKFFASGIRNENDAMASAIVLEGQMNLLDWDIDYEKIVDGESASHTTKWFHMNMKFNVQQVITL